MNDLKEVVLHIKLDSWDYKKAELIFYNVGSCFYQTEEGTIIENLDCIQDFCILSDGEIPSISFALKHLKISHVGTIKDTRLFYFSGSESSNTYGSIYIFAENWSMKTL